MLEKHLLTIMSIVSSSGILVNKDLGLAIITLLVLKGKFSISKKMCQLQLKG